MQHQKLLTIVTLLVCMIVIAIVAFVFLLAKSEEIYVEVDINEFQTKLGSEVSSQHYQHQPAHQHRLNNNTQHQNRGNFTGHLGTNHNPKNPSHHYGAHNNGNYPKNHNNYNITTASMSLQNGQAAVKQVQILKPPNRNLVVVDITTKSMQNGGGSTVDDSSNVDKSNFNRKQHGKQRQQQQNSNESTNNDQEDIESESAININNSNNNSSPSTEEADELSDKSMKLISEDAITEKCQKSNMSNDKTKTPMCLVNELARCNHITHQYRLTDERGPPHKKIFTVTLQLGEENYTAEGASIKKAQHLAAAEAMRNTKYPQPVEKAHRQFSNRTDKYGYNTVTPMVELNTISMKRNETFNISYQYPKAHHAMENGSAGFHHYRHASNRFHNGRNQYHRNMTRTSLDDPYKAIIRFEDRQYLGIGTTMPSAKQDAANKALMDMRESEKATTVASVTDEFSGDTSGNNMSQQSTDSADSTVDELNQSKSAISMVYELASKRELSTKFEVADENGPAHMKQFIINCSVSGGPVDIVTTGEGNSKKTAKKSAAEKMLIELQKLSPLPMRHNRLPLSNGHVHGRMVKRNTQSIPVASNPQVRRRSRNLIKETVSADGSSEGSTVDDESTNPISRLIRIQQSRKHREPTYTVIEERGQQRRKEFVIEVDASGEKALGIGRTKKQAKRVAAENLLIKMGQMKESEATELMKAAAVNKPEKSRKVTFKEPEILPSAAMSSTSIQNLGGTAGRQLVPGVLLMKNQDSKSFKTPPQSGINHKTTATIAKELLNAGTSPTAEAIVNKHGSPVQEATSVDNGQSTPTASDSPDQQTSSTSSSLNASVYSSTISNSTGQERGIRPTSQLMYLANLLKFEVQFNDFPKGLHNDFLTLVSLNTEPPQIFHGSGNTPDASKDQAAMNALRALSELGLDNVNKSKQQQQQQPAPPTQPLKPILTNGLNKANN